MSAYDEVPNTTGTPASPNYSYDTNHPHAVSAKTVDATRSNSYGYDALGNMVTRNYWQPDLATASWVQHNQALQYNAENKLTTVQEGGATIASFVYDGAGSRVLGTVNGETIAYVGAHYEVNVTSGAVTKYYGGNALKKNGNLQYLFKDHLGSVVGSLDANSGVIESQRSYKPFGDDLLMRGTIPTTLGYTGQRQEPELGLYFYNARWYDPVLGRFAQADTIVPNPTDAKAFDRYAYVNNNPVRYNDPSGHMCSDPEDPTPECENGSEPLETPEQYYNAQNNVISILKSLGVTYNPESTYIIVVNEAFIEPASVDFPNVHLKDPSISNSTWNGNDRNYFWDPSMGASPDNDKFTQIVVIELDEQGNYQNDYTGSDSNHTCEKWDRHFRCATAPNPSLPKVQINGSSATINFNANVANPWTPQYLTPGIRSDETVEIDLKNGKATVTGSHSAFPSHGITVANYRDQQLTVDHVYTFRPDYESGNPLVSSPVALAIPHDIR